MTKSTSIIPVERIECSILLIRGQKVMLDADDTVHVYNGPRVVLTPPLCYRLREHA